MKILHYTLGFAPYRSGGLMRYACDLMAAQKELGHEVTAFYPGSISIFEKRCTVVHETVRKGISVYEIVNPLPVPLLYGVKDIDSMMNERNLNEASFNQMLDETMPDILHVHTLMGLPKRYLHIAHDRGIRIVYTSHDYFGLCPKVNLIDDNGKICDDACGKRCSLCNMDAKSTWFLRIRNMKYLVPLKGLARRIKR